MKKYIFQFIYLVCSQWLQAQPIQFASDATPIIAQIEKTTSVKQYDRAFGQYTLILTADTISNTLLKASVHDSLTRSTRTYYFHNEYLVKLTEKFEPPSPVSVMHHFFFNTDYAIAIGYKNEEQKEVLVRQSLLTDAYRLLLYYRQIPH
ncbi:hypothetical protein [Flavisolibacter tropicus]|uniref:Uncharacterized protein n=1 Tax=Flavisolibacter tropicus TaxID=1492898 RepID=A0A172TVN8_9BACT|nr:hypothetical protein [Flavisolibacter tropicus]ANE50807.1 hypothetical protein SY85_10120 [Flavisolibacter tropicus]